jgi:hypothetical protein
VANGEMILRFVFVAVVVSVCLLKNAGIFERGERRIGE